MKINDHTISLNEQQEKAAKHTSGALQVIAGAGSGKTRVITARIAYLITHEKVPASAIVALTFTNKAANEMKERIAHFIGNDQELPFVGTFHSYCVRLLKENAHLADKPFISILDADDQKKLLQGILQRTNLHKQLAARQAAYHISQVKNKTLNFDAPSEQLFDNPVMPDVFRAYEEEKRESKALDFDDLLLEAVRLFKRNKEFKEKFQQKIQHILIDEYQDTNVVQRELLKQMALSGKKLAVASICSVGDEDQSIYSWRGATVTNMLNFQKDFPNTDVIKIEQNYRSVQPILDTANHVIQNNTLRSPKKLWSDRAASDRIKLLTCLSEYQEADAITQLVSVVKKHGVYKEIAVLYRTHTQSRAIEESFLKNSIPYKIIGGIQFYERKEIKDLLAYLKLVVNPFDRASLFRIINTPTRGFGQKFEEQFYALLKQEPSLPFYKAAERLAQELPPSKQKAIEQFLAIFDNLNPESLPSVALRLIIERTGYNSHIKKTYEPEDVQARIENIQELMDAVKHFENEEEKGTVALLLDEIALMQDKLKASDDDEQKVILMTLHAAKGLEFELIILAGLEQGVLPTSRALYDENDNSLEEERRLFYVGITRAKERLLITHTKFRYTYGQMTDQMPSQFLDELPSRYIVKEDCAYWNNVRFAHYFTDWLHIKKDDGLSSFAERKNQFAQLLKDKIASKESSKPKILPSRPTNNGFKKNQPVQHKTYGTGLVQSVEKKSDNTIVTVKFRAGIKKIVSRFLTAI